MGTGGGRGQAGSSSKCPWGKTTVKSCIILVCTIILDHWATHGHRGRAMSSGIIAKVFLRKNVTVTSCITLVCTVTLDNWARIGEGWAQGVGEGGRDSSPVFLGKNYGQIMYHTCLYGHFRQLGEDGRGMGTGGGRGWEKN